MNTNAWIKCPVCNNKTRVQIRPDTDLKNFPLFYPKYRTFFYDGYLCEVSESVMEHIRNCADKMFKYEPLEGK